ncbi:hypothetical protein [Pseudomonas sp. LW8]|uniref:hypothetical protein n=1 Tax=Pseudomonas sp. LW8 TaxID=3242677 RepID=UPI0035C07FA2
MIEPIVAKGELNHHEAPTRIAKPVEGAGRIAANIGTGENARNAIVWMTITWSFIIASGLSVLLFSLVVADKDFKYLEQIKSVWTIFIPLITLALGYSFGKSQ